MSARASILCVCLLAAAMPVHAQSIFNSAGIGLPLEPLDGRARALGSFGLGLPGTTLMHTDPGAAGRVLLGSGVITVQPSWVKLTESGTGDRTYFKGTRFPLLAVGYPVRGGMMTVNVSSVFDQRYQGSRTVPVVLGGSTVTATDGFSQDGSVSSLALGYSRMVHGSTSVGLTLGRYTGRLTRALVRTFDTSGTGVTVASYQSVGTWRYSGESLTAGVTTDVRGVLRVAASATISTGLTADATGLTAGGDRSFDVPLQLRVGASSLLIPGLTLHASAFHADWSGTGDDIGSAASAGSVTGVGAGIELSRAQLFGREAPLRVGFRRTGLPFAVGSEPATERVLSGGVALVLSQSAGVVLAGVDLAVEKGQRSGGTLTEDFWRGTASVRLSGF